MAGKKPNIDPRAVFLNVPYDKEFIELFLAYISGIVVLGMVPRAALEIPGSQRRLDRILDIVADCKYSIHDLSRVELDSTPPPTPRFNMLLELGLSVAFQEYSSHWHEWFIFETINWRQQK